MKSDDNLALEAQQQFRVLIVEDVADQLTSLTWLLEVEGYTIFALDNLGPGAIEEALAFQPAVALVDIEMPGASGLSVVPRLAAAGTKVICMSGWSTLKHRSAAAAAGCVDFLVKPVPFNELLMAVGRYCTRKA